MKKLFSLLSLLATGLLSASAATITVTTTFDVVDGNTSSMSALTSSPGADAKISLREAVIAVNNTGTGHVISLPAGTYQLTLAGASENNSATGDLDFRASNTTVQGSGAGVTIIQQTITDRVIEVNPTLASAFTFSISGVTIANGNVTSIGGGGMLAGSSSGLTTITDCIFSNNQSSSAAGGLGHDAGSLSISGCTFTGNSAPATGGNGGAIRFIASGADTMTLNNSTFVNNSASSTTSGGGALSLSGSSATYNLSRCYFGGNRAPSVSGKGGAIYVASGTMNITASGFATNQAAGASGFAGAVYVNSGNTTITYSRFIANTAATAANGLAVYRNTGNAGSLTANDNWWGSNSGPAANTVVNGTVSTYLQLRHSANPTTIAANGTSTLTADILKRSDGSTISSANLSGLPSFPAPAATIFNNPVLGSLTSAGTQMVNGSATATFVAGSTRGSASANATVDGQTVTANLTIEAPAIVTNVTSTLANGSYRAGQVVPITVTFDQAVTVSGTPQLTLETGSSDAVLNYASGSGGQTLTFNYTVASGHTSSDLDYTSTGALTLNGGSIRSGALNINAVLTLPSPGSPGSLGANKSIVIDTTPPTISISAPSVTTTNGGSVTYTVTYTGSDAVTLANGHVSINPTGTATASATVSGSGTATRTVTLSSISGNGTLSISIAAGTASDAAGNTCSAAGPSTAFTVDTTAPAVSIGAPSVSLTNGGTVVYTVTYTGADAVTLANTQITVNTIGNAVGTASVSGSGTTTRTVTLSGISGNGTLGISIAPGTAKDNAGNTAPAAGPSATFTVDTAPPTLSIGAPSTSTTTPGGNVNYTVTYGGADTITLASGHITLNRSGNANGTVSVSGSGTTRAVTISSITGEGTIGISIGAGTASDSAGNLAAAAGPSITFAVVSTNANLVNLGLSSGPFTPSFSANVTNYSATVPSSVTNITITPTSEHPGASIQVRINQGAYGTVASGTASPLLSLTYASTNSIDIKVTAADGVTTKIYNLEVAQVLSTNANLASLNLSAAALTPPFNSSTTNYTANVTTDVTNTTITATVADPNSAISVRINDGLFAPINSGEQSSSLTLNVGTNSIEVKVIAEDSAISRLYTITVIRAVGPPSIDSITAQPGDSYLLQFSGAPGINYTIQVSTNLTTWDSLTNLTAGENGSFNFTHSAATNYPGLFYRLRNP